MVETAATTALRTARLVALDTIAPALAGSSFVAASMGMPMRLTMRAAKVGLSSTPTAPSRLLRSTGSIGIYLSRHFPCELRRVTIMADPTRSAATLPPSGCVGIDDAEGARPPARRAGSTFNAKQGSVRPPMRASAATQAVPVWGATAGRAVVRRCAGRPGGRPQRGMSKQLNRVVLDRTGTRRVPRPSPDLAAFTMLGMPAAGGGPARLVPRLVLAVLRDPVPAAVLVPLPLDRGPCRRERLRVVTVVLLEGAVDDREEHLLCFHRQRPLHTVRQVLDRFVRHLSLQSCALGDGVRRILPPAVSPGSRPRVRRPVAGS